MGGVKKVGLVEGKKGSGTWAAIVGAGLDEEEDEEGEEGEVLGDWEEGVSDDEEGVGVGGCESVGGTVTETVESGEEVDGETEKMEEEEEREETNQEKVYMQ